VAVAATPHDGELLLWHVKEDVGKNEQRVLERMIVSTSDWMEPKHE
jgi:hypothetical protein